MGLVAVEGMCFHGFHGFYEEERILGAKYMIDVYVETNFTKASAEDDLHGTINYEAIHLTAKSEMKRSVKLLETLATRIANNLKSQFENLIHIKIRVSKINPPLGGEVARAFVELDFNHKASCPKTKRPFLCYKDKNCWCKQVRVNEETQVLLKKKYKGCLSPDALKFYSV